MTNFFSLESHVCSIVQTESSLKFQYEADVSDLESRAGIGGMDSGLYYENPDYCEISAKAMGNGLSIFELNLKS